MSITKILSNIILVVCVVSLQSTGSSATEAERRLRRDLFSNHSADIRPVLNDSQPVEVYLSIELRQLVRIDENDQSFEIAAWLTQEWQETTLSWDVSRYNNIKKIRVKPDLLWRPDIYLYKYISDGTTDHGGRLSQMASEVGLTSDGWLESASRSMMKVRCNIDVHQFPYDSQECNLVFETWIYNAFDLTLKDGGIDVDWFEPNLQWHLTNHSSDQYILHFDGVPHSEVEFKFTFKRKSIFFTKLLIFSTGLITILMTFTFMLPEESGERMGMALTLMLSGLVFIMLVADSMPLNTSASGTPILSQFFTACLALKGIMIITLCFISRLYHKEEEDGLMGQWTRRIILNRLSYFVRVRSRKVIKVQIRRSETNENAMGDGKTEGIKKEGDKEENSSQFKMEWRIVAMTIDWCFFCLFLVIIVILFVSCFTSFGK